MRLHEYGIWVAGIDYKDLDEPQGYSEKWYPEGDLSIIPDLSLELPFVGFTYCVNGEQTAMFRLLLIGSEPWELEFWDAESLNYRPCCLVRANNVWDKMKSFRPR